jgi:endogenous inhibitor of DNA gyrase (YacG/DUF329 family)
MQQEYDSPDISEFIAACAKRFCPECGKAVEPNKNGRPKSFCSNRCRWAFNKRAERRKAKEESRNENSRTESAAGISAETG